MARVQQGDADAFGELYDRYAAPAFRVAQVICRDAGRAEDALKDAFKAIWTERAQFDPTNGSFKAWLMGIVKNQVIAPSRPGTQSEVIALAFFGGLSHSEIAALLDLPSGTVKGRMRLGLEELRKQAGVPT
ncbi:MAG TPA: sigma factor [Solirubrobacterales bacterium]|nr:sigma factor [Solirubrobacterales bacterium]